MKKTTRMLLKVGKLNKSLSTRDRVSLAKGRKYVRNTVGRKKLVASIRRYMTKNKLL